ncbi:nickel transporter permease [Paenibacillus sp. 8b26]|uniref:nickel transporter permease n=1 Tax=Paenibacillus sp. 8b26 TaxID=3424133 RepID=UPI003D65A1C4
MKNMRLSFKGSLLTGGVLLGLIVLLGVLAPWVAPHDPLDVDLLNRLAPPSRKYPFGTDHLGRDVLSRLIYGIRTSVLIACAITVTTLCISLPIGLLIGYVRGRVDQLVMRAIDGVLAFPDIILTVAIVGILGPGFVNMTLAIIAVRWAGYVRYIRTLVQKACQEDYVRYARLSGNSHVRVLRRYVLPQVLPQLLVYAVWDIGRVVLMVAGLSFLGLGVQPPKPEWGVMLHDATSYFQVAPHVMIFPGLAIMLFVLACQLLGDRFSEKGAAEWRMGQDR